MLSPSDLLLIVVTTAVCTGAVSLLAWLALRWNRRGSIASQFAIVIVAVVLSIACSTLAVLVEMFFSPHDLTVLVWVLGVSAVLSVTAAVLITGRTARRSLDALVASAQRVGDGAVVVAGTPGWQEFNELSAELAETSRRLAAARAELEKLDAARRQFYAGISHDLRTPLTGIRALAEALEDGVVEDAGATARRIGSRAEAMTRMVDDLFELSKLQEGTLRLQPELVELLDLVSDAVTDVQPLAERKGIRISQRGVEGRVLWADPRELSRVLGNLLSNGIRHAPEQSEILIAADTVGEDRLVLTVLDQGPGVAAEDLGRIFDVGWRADAARTAEEPSALSSGAGLGLAIVRGIVEAHGGNVRAGQVPDGFQLEVTLPLGGAGAGGAPPPASSVR